MIRIPYENLDANQTRALNYMRGIVRAGYQPGLEVLPRAALLKGYPVQDVWAATLALYQTGMNPDAIAGEPVPDGLREAFTAHVRQLYYTPSPIDTSNVAMTPQMKVVVDATARSIHENWREKRTAEGLTVQDNPLLKPWEELSPEDRASTISTAEGVVKALAATGGVTAADLDFRQTRDEICARLDEHVHDVWAKNKLEAGARYGVERTKNAEGRDLTHPDLVPFKDLSAASKAYDHDINVIILDTIHKEGLSIAPQMKNDIVIDTSHVKMTDALKAAAEKAAKTEHAMHLEMEPFEDSPVMKPWEELDPRDRQMMLDEAGKKLMLVAAIGGLSPEMFEDKESFGEICDTLDDFVMGQNHRTDRELVHEENEIFLQAVEKSGIVVEAQMSRDVEEMERRMKDAFRKEPGLEPELPGNYEKAARLLAEDRLRKEMDSPSRLFLPPKEHLDSTDTFEKAEAKVLSCASVTLCPKDTLVEKPDGTFVGIIPAGTSIDPDRNGHLDMNKFLSVGNVDFRDFENRQACLKAIYDRFAEGGFRVDPLALKDPSRGAYLNNLYDDAVAEKMLSDARREIKVLQEKGFTLMEGYNNIGDALGGELGRLISFDISNSSVVKTLYDNHFSVSYSGSDKNVIRAIHDDRAHTKFLSRQAAARSASSSQAYVPKNEWSMAQADIVNVFMDNFRYQDMDRNDLLPKRVEAFVKDLKDPRSRASVLMDSLPDYGTRDMKVAEAFRMSAWMTLTGCSYSTANNRSILPDKFNLPKDAISDIDEYKAQKDAYEKRGVLGKVFSREPKPPVDAIKRMSDELRWKENDWKGYMAIENAFADYPDSQALLADRTAYMAALNDLYVQYTDKMQLALAGVPGAESVIIQAKSLRENVSKDISFTKTYTPGGSDGGDPHRHKAQYEGPVVKSEDVRVLREYGIPEDVIKTVVSEGAAEFMGVTHNRPSTETSPADPRLDVKTSMRLERTADGRIIVKDPVGRDMKVGDFLKMGYRDLLAKKPEKKAEPKRGIEETKGPKIK